MIVLPQRLFDSPAVTTILRDGNVCILTKELKEAIVNREGYISNHVVSMVLEGEQRIQTYEDELIRVKAGELLFIPRGMYYVTDLLPKTGHFRSILFYFDEDIIQDFLASSKVSSFSSDQLPDYLKLEQSSTIQLFVDALIAVYQDHQLQNKAFLKVKLLELLHLLNSQVPNQDFANFLFRLTLPKKRNIKSFMSSNFDKPLKIEDYAYLTGRSISSFRRDFKNYFNTTPQKWIKTKRLEKAVALLQQKEMSVTDLAFEVGYENISYFIKEFKQEVGLSPKQYILSHRQDKF